jgi:hypothetical protein
MRTDWVWICCDTSERNLDIYRFGWMNEAKGEDGRIGVWISKKLLGLWEFVIERRDDLRVWFSLVWIDVSVGWILDGCERSRGGNEREGGCAFECRFDVRRCDCTVALLFKFFRFYFITYFMFKLNENGNENEKHIIFLPTVSTESKGSSWGSFTRFKPPIMQGYGRRELP